MTTDARVLPYDYVPYDVLVMLEEAISNAKRLGISTRHVLEVLYEHGYVLAEVEWLTTQGDRIEVLEKEATERADWNADLTAVIIELQKNVAVMNKRLVDLGEPAQVAKNEAARRKISIKR